MAAPKQTASPMSLSAGNTMRLVVISAISADGLSAVCTDRTGFEVRVPLLQVPAKGVLPAVGDQWYLTQETGAWAFCSFVGTSPDQFAEQTGTDNTGPPGPQGPPGPSGPPGPTGPPGAGAESSQTGSVLTVNPYLTGGSLNGWQPYGGTLAATQSPPGPFPWSAKIAATSTAGFGLEGTTSNVFHVTTNNQYLVSGWIYVNGGPASQFAQVGVDWLSPSKTVITTETANVVITPNTWTPVSTVVSTSNGAVIYGRPRLGPSVSVGAGMQAYVSGLLVLPQVPGGLIQAGTITAAQIAAGTVVAGIVDGTIVSAADFLQYFGSPASGTLTGSWSDAGGTDSYGNPYAPGMNLTSPQQINFNGPDGSVLSLLPAADEQITLTPAISGLYQTALMMATNDANEVAPGHMASVIMNPGAASQQMAMLMHAPNQGLGAGLFLMSESDDSTLGPAILLCSVTSDGESDTITPVAEFQPYAFVMYGGSSGTQVVTKTSGSGSIPVSGATVGKVECWGPATGGHCGIVYPATANGGQYGGAGGEYSCEPALPLNGTSIAYSVPAGSPGTAPGQGTPANPGNTTANNGLGTGGAPNTGIVTAHGGTITGNLPIGGQGSLNTIHFNGGNGGTNPHSNSPTGNYNGGAGGGSSAGTKSRGGAGFNTSSNSGASGAVAPVGGGSGGKGGAVYAGAPGATPGGGGGGGWANANSASSGGNGGHGQVRVTFTPAGANPLIMASIASAPGVDQFGTAFGAGLYLNNQAAPATPVGGGVLYGAGGHVYHAGADGGFYGDVATVRLAADAPQCSSTGQSLTGLQLPVGVGTYAWDADVLIQAQSANNAYLTMGGPAVSDFICWIMWNMQVTGSYTVNNPTNLFRVQNTIGVNTGLNSGGLINGQVYTVRLWGYATFTAGGTLSVNQASSANAASFTVKKGNILRLYPQHP